MNDFSPFGIEERQDQFHEQSIYSVALIYNVIQSRIGEFLKAYGLTLGKFNILMVIKHRSSGDGIKQVDISKHLIVTPSNMTKLIDKLEQDKLVARSAQQGDRRVNLIKITSKGKKLLDDIWDDYCLTMKGLAGGLGKSEHKELSKSLLKWLSSVKS